MPIKFRCLHCQQFLGISRSRAGAVVDCPTCGRSLRVPSSDGKVEPLPAPKLDLKDSALASALDELAMIGREPDGTDPIDAEPAAPDHEVATPESRAATLPAPAPQQPEPISFDPPLPAKRIEPAANRAEGGGDPAHISAESSGSMIDLLPQGEAAQLFEGVSASPVDGRTVRGPVSVWVLPAVVVVGIGIFLAGYILGSRGESSPDPSIASDQNNGKNPANNGEAGGESAAVTGRITYRTAEGESRPDVGARIIVLPEKRTGTAKLSVVGLRPADVQADLGLARAGLRALGGDVASVAGDGSYSIHLPRAGTYRMLILSHHQARDDTDSAGEMATVQSVLEVYFDRPQSLLGRLRFQLETLRYSGTRTQLRDHTFERQP